jgi:hypothetical protein
MKFEFSIPIPVSVKSGELGHPDTIVVPLMSEGVTVSQNEDSCIFSTDVATRDRGIKFVDYLLIQSEEKGVDILRAKLTVDGKRVRF